MRQSIILLTLIMLSCAKPTDSKLESEIVDSLSLKSADRFAEFPGGRLSRDKYIKDNWKWIEPTDTIEGFVFVGFIVKEDGTLTDIKVLKGVCESCDSEAIRLVSEMPKWTPAHKNGVTMDQKFTLPIMFQSSAVKAWQDIHNKAE